MSQANPEVLNHLRRTLADSVLSQNASKMRAMSGYLRLIGTLDQDDPQVTDARELIRETFKSLELALSEIP